MARVEYSARTEDETYSPSKDEGGSESENQDPRSKAQDYEIREDGQSFEVEGSLTGLSAGAAPSFNLPGDSPAQISFFA
jgi:DNA-binding IclR family transcriptional regulator